MIRMAGVKWCPETESNRHVLLGTRDFKSRASASFAIRASVSVHRIIQDPVWSLAGARGTNVRNQIVNSRIGRLTTCRRARKYPIRRKLLPRNGISLQPAEWEAVMAGTTVRPKPERTNWKMLAS